MEQVLSSPAIINTVLSILGLLASYLVTRILRDRTMSKERTVAIDALIAGVQIAWDDIGRDWKDRSVDGKFLKEERLALQAKAASKAMTIAQNQGVELLMVIAKEEVPALIHRIIAKRKKGEL